MGKAKPKLKLYHFFIFLICFVGFCRSQAVKSGEWNLVRRSIGISAMHMQLLHNNFVVMFDRTDFGPSNLSLPYGRCRYDPSDTALEIDCTAHSLLFDLSTSTVQPLSTLTDTWCSSGSLLSDGTLLQTGGYNDGDRVIRTLAPCQDCDWVEHPGYLAVRRWYATDQLLPDGRVIVLGGRRQYNYEFYPRNDDARGGDSIGDGTYRLDFLQETRDGDEENNLYPFLHLLPDGNLFIFANSRAILFDHVTGQVVREFPPIPGEQPRNYPSSGSSVLLPLHLDGGGGDNVKAEVMVCGGAPRGSFTDAVNGTFRRALTDCARLVVTDPDSNWIVEEMPMARVMGDMLLLPSGDAIIINGAMNGTAGWELGREPALSPVLYRPDGPDSARFQILSPSAIPRLYHSAAVVIPDGRVLVGGSNPHVCYNFSSVDYPTELSIETFSPPYLSMQYAPLRPKIISVVPGEELEHGEPMTVNFFLAMYLSPFDVSTALLAPTFTTHGLSMNQRLLFLEVIRMSRVSAFTYQAIALAPPTAALAPPGYYMLFVVHAGVPSQGVWMRLR